MNNNINIIEDEPAALFDAKVAFIDRALEDGRLTVVNTIFAETNEDNQHNLIANIGRIEISRRQFKGLDANGLICDNIIDGYFNLLKDRNPKTYFFPTYFYTFMTAQLSKGIDSSCVREWFRNLQIFDYELIIIPCFFNNHWLLVTINYRFREIKYYDFANGSGLEVRNNIFLWLKQFSIVRYGTELFENQWRLLDVNNPLQTNQTDCGIFIMIYAELFSEGHLRMFSFDQEDMNRFRLMIALSILNEEINYF